MWQLSGLKAHTHQTSKGKEENVQICIFKLRLYLENVILAISDFYIKSEKKALSKVANVYRSGLQRWGF